MTKEQRKFYYKGWSAALKGAGICRDCRSPHSGETTRCAKCTKSNSRLYARRGTKR